MGNITLKIDDGLLEKARSLALQRKTSISAIVKEKLEEFVSTNVRREATLRSIEDFFLRSKAKIGKRTWNRDELHER